jgi:peroxiredoxin
MAAAGCAASRSAAPGAGGPPLALTAPDGRTVSLDELRGRDATVLVFWSGTCPCVRRYQERVDALLDRWPGERVRVLGVSSNAGETFADALRVAGERGVRVPIYRDPGGRLAEAVGARSTPTVAVLDGRGELRFLGWIDNERPPGDPRREPWLERAVSGVLDGPAGFAARTPTYGCVITRSLFEAGSCHEVPKDERNTP